MLLLAALALVYGLSLVFALRFLVQRITRSKPKESRRLIWFRRAIFVLAAIGASCFVYALRVEPYWLDVSHARITSPRIPAGSQPLRIVHISDLHCDPQPRLEERLPDIIANQQPDLIVFTGDSVNSPDGLPVLKKCLSALAKIAPTYVVKGNWDSWYWRELDLFGGTGVKELKADSEAITIRGIPVRIAGLAVGQEANLDKTLAESGAGEVKIFLYHYPDLIHQEAGHGVDLYCAGHTHGGQVALPFYGALVTFSRFGKRYESGLHREGNTWLYVNRGIGMEGGRAPRVRFFARPEVTVISIHAEVDGKLR